MKMFQGDKEAGSCSKRQKESGTGGGGQSKKHLVPRNSTLNALETCYEMKPERDLKYI